MNSGRVFRYDWTAKMDVQVAIRWPFLLGLVFMFACDINGSGLSSYDAGEGSDVSPAVNNQTFCPNGLLEHANWLPAIKERLCTKRCGPDDIGTQICQPVDLLTCQKTQECVCAIPPCTACTPCAFSSIPACLRPTNAEKPNRCLAGVQAGGACTPACSRTLCLLGNGKDACICNASGLWTCATWSQQAWR